MFAPFEEEASPLIRATAPDGALFVFAILAERRCQLTRNGDVIFTAPATPEGIDSAIDMMVRAVESPSSVGAG